MYNGIGLTSVRGTATSGYIQQNAGHVRNSSHRHRTWRNATEGVGQAVAPNGHPLLTETALREGASSLAMHEKKRRLEVQLLELRDRLEERGWDHAKIEKEVEWERNQTLERWAKIEERVASHVEARNESKLQEEDGKETKKGDKGDLHKESTSHNSNRGERTSYRQQLLDKSHPHHNSRHLYEMNRYENNHHRGRHYYNRQDDSVGRSGKGGKNAQQQRAFQEERNQKLRNALGIREDKHKEGAAFDRELQEKKRQEKQLQKEELARKEKKAQRQRIREERQLTKSKRSKDEKNKKVGRIVRKGRRSTRTTSDSESSSSTRSYSSSTRNSNSNSDSSQSYSSSSYSSQSRRERARLHRSRRRRCLRSISRSTSSYSSSSRSRSSSRSETPQEKENRLKRIDRDTNPKFISTDPKIRDEETARRSSSAERNLDENKREQSQRSRSSRKRCLRRNNRSTSSYSSSSRSGSSSRSETPQEKDNRLKRIDGDTNPKFTSTDPKIQGEETARRSSSAERNLDENKRERSQKSRSSRRRYLRSNNRSTSSYSSSSRSRSSSRSETPQGKDNRLKRIDRDTNPKFTSTDPKIQGKETARRSSSAERDLEENMRERSQRSRSSSCSSSSRLRSGTVRMIGRKRRMERSPSYSSSSHE